MNLNHTTNKDWQDIKDISNIIKQSIKNMPVSEIIGCIITLLLFIAFTFLGFCL
jgi:hypothetical protein